MASIFNNYIDLFSEGTPTGMIFFLSFPQILSALSGKIDHTNERYGKILYKILI